MTKIISVNKFLSDYAQAFDPITKTNLAIVFPTLTTELQVQDFVGIKQILDYLLKDNKITREIYDTILNLFLKQGVNLNHLS